MEKKRTAHANVIKRIAIASGKGIMTNPERLESRCHDRFTSRYENSCGCPRVRKSGRRMTRLGAPPFVLLDGSRGEDLMKNARHGRTTLDAYAQEAEPHVRAACSCSAARTEDSWMGDEDCVVTAVCR